MSHWHPGVSGLLFCGLRFAHSDKNDKNRLKPPPPFLDVRDDPQACLRAATGAHAAASFEHVHQESLVLPVEDHLNLLSRQFLAQASLATHASHAVVSAAPGPRDARKSLTQRQRCGRPLQAGRRHSSGQLPRRHRRFTHFRSRRREESSRQCGQPCSPVVSSACP